MQETSALYKQLLDGDHYFEYTLTIGDTGNLITEHAETITFGGIAINVASGNAESGFRESMIYSMDTSNNVFGGDTPTIGGCVSGELNVKLKQLTGVIERAAPLRPYVRVTDFDGNHSEWIPKGVFYIDYREEDAGSGTVTLHGYDAMIRADNPYPASRITWGSAPNDLAVLQEIADNMGVEIDPRTFDIISRNRYTIPLPSGYTMREVLGYIAAAYCGNFIMSDEGALLLIAMNDLPDETSYIITENGAAILFGGVAIRLE